MEPDTQATLLRIFIGEGDRHGHESLHEAIVKEARKAGLAGATVLRGILSYGASTHLRSGRILDLSGDLPVVIEIADTEARIAAFRPVLDRLFEASGGGGLVTLETVRIVKYVPGKT